MNLRGTEGCCLVKTTITYSLCIVWISGNRLLSFLWGDSVCMVTSHPGLPKIERFPRLWHIQHLPRETLANGPSPHDSSVGKESACNTGDLDSIPGLGRSPGEGKGYPLQYSGLENSTRCIVHRVAKSRMLLSDFHFHLYFSVVLYG